jgi:hypothetical protein
MTGLIIDDRNLAPEAVTTPSLADDALAATATGRGKMQDGYFDSSTLQSKVGAGALDAAAATAIIGNDAIDSPHYAAGSVDGEHLSTDAKQATLQSKFVPAWVQVSAYTALGTGDTTTIKAAIVAAASNDTFRPAPTDVGILYSQSDGLATGDPNQYKIQIRNAGTDQPVDDGAGGEVYGILTSNNSVSVEYFKADHTSFSFPSTSIDFLFAEIFTLETLPTDAFLSGASFGDISATTSAHNHTLSEVSDVTSTAAEVNKLDGTGANVTPTNLNLLVDAGDAGALHNHDGQYSTETELGGVGTGNPNTTAGAALVGTDASALGPVAGATDTVQAVLEAIVAALGTERANEAVATVNQTTNVALADNLDFTPVAATKVQLLLNGMQAIYGTHFTMSGKIITWLGATFELKATDTLRAFYRSSD